MKQILLSFLILLPTICIAQRWVMHETDSTSITKPEHENEKIDSAIFTSLKEFHDENDAIIYLYKVKSFVGGAKMPIDIGKERVTELKGNEYLIIHIDTKVKYHLIRLGWSSFKYTNFKPNTYYYIRFKKEITTGYLNDNTLAEIKKCKQTKSVEEWFLQSQYH